MNREGAKKKKSPSLPSRSSRLRGKSSSKPIELRYVVLHHTGVENPHYDLMLELTPGSQLSTWRLPHWPPTPGDPFTPLPNHRRDYLEYEGPISNNRGQVKRIAAGSFQILSRNSSALVIMLENPTMKITLPIPASR